MDYDETLRIFNDMHKLEKKFIFPTYKLPAHAASDWMWPLQKESTQVTPKFAAYRGIAFNAETGDIVFKEDCFTAKGQDNARDRFLRSIPADVEVDDLTIEVRPF